MKLMKEKSKERVYPRINDMTHETHRAVVKDMFSTISREYDFLNHIMSLRRDILWRRFVARKLKFFKTFRFLDIATGTADMAIEASKIHPKINVTAVDFVREMMDRGRKKISMSSLFSRINLVTGDAMNLPFSSNSFDAAGICFGIRNIPDKAGALREMARVVVPGGKILILEMTLPEIRFINRVYRIYLNRILPRMAALFSHNPAAYFYLGDSIMQFPKPGEFVDLMLREGLEDMEILPLTLGITHLFIGKVK